MLETFQYSGVSVRLRYMLVDYKNDLLIDFVPQCALRSRPPYAAAAAAAVVAAVAVAVAAVDLRL